jgi:hypothetical protein
MQTFSTSLTLGKASTGNANIEHNNREYLADNIDVNRICDNVVYVHQNIEAVYEELFSESVAEYNLKQKQPCRRIHNYYEHIETGKREEPYYELVVQFGDMKTAGVGTPNGDVAVKMLDDYIRSFKQRNPNLHIIGAYLHKDEASPHCHIDFIPFYTQGRKNGLSKGVSMKAALIEQGFNPQGQNRNQLVLWQDSEREVMEKILQRHGFSREVKNANHAHQSVPEYKQSQDAKRLLAFARQSQELDPTIENISKLQQANDLLEVEKAKLLSQQSSPWVCFFYQNEEKQSFVTAELDRRNIPYRSTENGFESQACFTDEIRKIEKQYKPKENSLRADLRDLIDKTLMQSKSFDEFLQQLRDNACEIKHGKYLAIKPKYAVNFIRTKSLGENYSEQSLRNRLTYKTQFEESVNNKIVIAEKSENQNTLEVMTLKTIRHYTVVFAAGVLPVRKKNKKKPFSWENCEELDKLSALNKKISAGATLESIRNEFAVLEKSVAEKEKQVDVLKSELDLFRDLYKRAERCFKYHSIDEQDLAVLAEHQVSAENYQRITQLVIDNESEIVEIESALPELRRDLQSASKTLTLAEKVAGGTWVQSLIDEEKHRAQADFIPNGFIATDSPAGVIQTGGRSRKM